MSRVPDLTLRLPLATKFTLELLSTFIFVSVIFLTGNPVAIAAALYIGISISSRFTGGHLNPAVSLAMLFSGALTVQESVVYMVSQIVAALSAAFIWTRVFIPPTSA